MKKLAKPTKPTNANIEQTERTTIMPGPTLADFMKALDEAESDYVMEPRNPLADGWEHMQQSRGWK